MEPNHFKWIFWSPSSQFPISAILLLLMKGLCPLAKHLIVHHTDQSYRCGEWNITADDLSHLCHHVVRDQSTLSLCNHELEFPQYQKLNCLPYNDVHSYACTVSNSPFVDLLTNKSMNIEVILFPGNELLKHGFDDAERQIMSCLLSVHCTYNILITFKTRIQLGLVRRQKLNAIKSGSSSSLDEG